MNAVIRSIYKGPAVKVLARRLVNGFYYLMSSTVGKCSLHNRGIIGSNLQRTTSYQFRLDKSNFNGPL